MLNQLVFVSELMLIFRKSEWSAVYCKIAVVTFTSRPIFLELIQKDSDSKNQTPEIKGMKK